MNLMVDERRKKSGKKVSDVKVFVGQDRLDVAPVVAEFCVVRLLVGQICTHERARGIDSERTDEGQLSVDVCPRRGCTTRLLTDVSTSMAIASQK